MNRTVAIVGKAQMTRDFAPYVDRSVDIWAYNNFAMRHGRRVDGVFEMHTDALTTERYSPEYRAWLQEPHPFPIWMHDADKRIPAGRKYPLTGIVDKYLRHVWRGRERVERFFTSSTPYALALALYLDYERIELYGIELSSSPEYTAERDCVFFWEGVANAWGVDVVVHPLTNLYDAPLYGVA